jgi:hypothetical protein
MADSTNIKKQVEAIDKQDRNLKVLREQMKSKCPHTDKNGDLDIVPKQNRQNGELTYICKRCQKTLNLKKISPEQLAQACEIVDNACDVIKLSLDTQKEADLEILKRIGKVQYRVRNEVQKYYDASLKKNKSGGKGKGRGGNNESSSWGNPTINGR